MFESVERFTWFVFFLSMAFDCVFLCPVCVCVFKCLCDGNRLTQAVSFKLLLVSSVFFINDLGATALRIPAIPPPDSLSARQMLIVFIIAGCAGPVKRAHLTPSTFPFNVFLCAAPCSYHSFILCGWPSADKGSRLTLSTYYMFVRLCVTLCICTIDFMKHHNWLLNIVQKK